MALKDQSFAERLGDLCDEYFEPPLPASIKMERMNSLLGGTRKPTIEELIAISEAFDVSINYLLTGDEMFPSLHRLKKKDAERLKREIEDLTPEIDE